MSDLGGLIRGEWNGLAELLLWFDGHLGGLRLGRGRVRGGLSQGLLQILEFYGCQ
jgi:hypothetical protein